MKLIDKLNVLRNAGGKARTVGLTDATIERFAARFPELGAAIDDAHAEAGEQRRASGAQGLDDREELLGAAAHQSAQEGGLGMIDLGVEGRHRDGECAGASGGRVHSGQVNPPAPSCPSTAGWWGRSRSPRPSA